MAITRCPKCRETNVRRSRRRFFDFLFRSIGMVPLRCNICEHRFFRFRRSLATKPHQVTAFDSVKNRRQG
jgi:hypothetical protein